MILRENFQAEFQQGGVITDPDSRIHHGYDFCRRLFARLADLVIDLFLRKEFIFHLILDTSQEVIIVYWSLQVS